MTWKLSSSRLLSVVCEGMMTLVVDAYNGVSGGLAYYDHETLSNNRTLDDFLIKTSSNWCIVVSAPPEAKIHFSLNGSVSRVTKDTPDAILSKTIEFDIFQAQIQVSVRNWFNLTHSKDVYGSSRLNSRLYYQNHSLKCSEI